MQTKPWFIVSILIAALGFGAQIGCGPNCAKIVTTKSPEDLNYEDALRINDFVKRRTAAMKAADGGDMYIVEDAKLTVTACEFAIHMMLRTKNLYEDQNPLYEENIAKINETRCYLDEVLTSKGKLIGKGKDAFLSSGTAEEMRDRFEEFENIFGKEGTLSERSTAEIYNKGVKSKKKAKPGKDGKVAPEEETEGAGSAIDEGDDMGGDEGVGSGEGDGEEGEGEEGEGEASSGMDSF